MSGTLSTRWFWSDWLSDPGLRACGFAARGLWKDMLCIAGGNKGRDHGFVAVNGKPLGSRQLAHMLGGTVAEIEPLIGELETNGVFSRDRRDAIYCRRMVRAEKSRPNGRLGGNPKLLKTKENPEQVKPDPKPHIPKPLPEPKEVKTPQASKPTPDASDWPADYREQFWERYPRKTEKKAALAKLDGIKKSKAVSWTAFSSGIDRYVEKLQRDRTEERYIKHPTTWLNRGCWDDEYPTGRGPPINRESKNGPAALMALMMKQGAANAVNGEDYVD